MRKVLMKAGKKAGIYRAVGVLAAAASVSYTHLGNLLVFVELQ